MDSSNDIAQPSGLLQAAEGWLTTVAPGGAIITTGRPALYRFAELPYEEAVDASVVLCLVDEPAGPGIIGRAAQTRWVRDRWYRQEVGSRSAPNIVIILTDDLGWGDIGANGALRIPTPSVDRLAREGVTAIDAHSSSAVCTPSRYSMLTGRYAWRSPLKRGVLGPWSPPIIEPGRTTIASALAEAGYATAAFGKWHLGLGWRRSDGTRADAFQPGAGLPWEAVQGDPMRPGIDFSAPFTGGPCELGFDRFTGTAASLDMPPYCLLDQDRTRGIPDRARDRFAPGQRPGPAVEGWRDDEVDVRIVAEACDWMRGRPADRPFFLYLATHAPHRPWVPPAFIRGASDAGVRGDCVALADWVTGEVLRCLDELGIGDDTIVVFASDNGAPTRFPEDGHPEHAPNGDWRGQKADIWDGGHRIPLVVRWPERIPEGGTVDVPVCLTDVLPTLTAAAGAPVPRNAEVDGAAILGLLTGAGDHGSDPAERALVHHANDGSFGIRVGRYKAVFTTGSGGFSQPLGEPVGPDAADGQLYDLAADPAERVNLWDERPEVVAALWGQLLEIAGDEPVAAADRQSGR